MDGAGAYPGGGIAPARPPRDFLSWLLPFATALGIVVVAVLGLTTPLWMHPALGATGAGVPGHLDQTIAVSDETVQQLLFGPGDFDVRFMCPGTGPCPTVYTADEAAHLRDARLLLWLGITLAVASAVLIGAALVHRPKDARRWRAVARGGAGLAIGAVVVVVVGYFAFDALFTLFHEVFFPQGNWEFPPDSNMIRLYPYAFWQLTAAALGALCVIGGGIVWWFARRRVRAAE
ncbi:MAG: DUF1461 domain-containing protein [Chloroflexota bacterium]|nr:DUF1461 domain-containing protein [Chloroflexota bacterium]